MTLTCILGKDCTATRVAMLAEGLAPGVGVNHCQSPPSRVVAGGGSACALIDNVDVLPGIVIGPGDKVGCELGASGDLGSVEVVGVGGQG